MQVINRKSRYVIHEKKTSYFMARPSEIYSDGEVCDDIEYADTWLDDEDAQEYIDNILDKPKNFEVMIVVINYEIKGIIEK